MNLNKRLQLLQVFNNFDADGNGFVDIEEVEQMLKKFGHKYDRKKLEELISKIDQNGNFFLETDEFMKIIEASKPDPKKEAKEIFELCDVNNDGKLEINGIVELIKLMNNRKISQDQAQDYLNLLDLEKKGYITFEEFCKFFTAED